MVKDVVDKSLEGGELILLNLVIQWYFITSKMNKT